VFIVGGMFEITGTIKKIFDEQSRPLFNKLFPIPKGFDWPALLKVNGDDFETLYRYIINSLGKRPWHVGHHLPQGAEQNPGPRQAPPSHRLALINN
jgi:hypothetical protein